MAGVVTVLLVVDTHTLLEKVPNPSLDAKHPTEIGDFDGCYLIAPPNETGRGVAGAEVNLVASAGASANGKRPPPHIRWRTLSLSGPSDNAAILYRVAPDTALGRAGVTASRAFEVQQLVPLPTLVDNENTDPPSFESAIVQDYFLESRLRKPGQVPFLFSFYVTTCDQVGKPALAGYFRWRGSVATN